jgi:cell division septation protein DedD
MPRTLPLIGARAIACVALLGLLAACAGQTPRTSATQEAARYVAHARGDYTPPGPPGDPWGPYIHEASQRFDVPAIWIRAVMHVESGGNQYQNGQLITSGAGAMGLMQVMPSTYDELRARYVLGDDPFDPHSNVLAGTAYLREMYDIYGAPGFLAAYNAGPARLDDYLSNNRPLPDETRHYVAMIGPAIEGVYPRTRSPAEAYAMNTLPINIPPGPRYGRATQFASASARGAVGAVGRAPRAPVQTAQLLEPPPPARAAPPERQVALALPPPPLPLPQPRRGGFHLVPVANAEPMPERRGGPTTGNWAIQIGAFSKPSLAHEAIDTAKTRAHDTLAAAHPMVALVHESHGTLYRARLAGLSREAAITACERLRGHGACMVLSPESQS